MESPRTSTTFRNCLLVFAVCIALEGGIFLRDSFRDPFPQGKVPSLGVTADTVVRIVQHDLSHQRRLAGLQLLACAGMILAAAQALRRPSGD